MKRHSPWQSPCRARVLLGLCSLLVAAPVLVAAPAWAHGDGDTATPIKHLVVIFQENVSFDHYFATYPHAANNNPNEPRFQARPDTPSVNGLSGALLSRNPNSAAPFRLSRAQAATCDQDHGYTAEQAAFDFGLMDKFVEFTGNGDPNCDPRLVMAYFDGNTVTALWNYAQHFAMSDNSFGTVFGPSTPGALNLISGQTHGATPADAPPDVLLGSVIGDPEPGFDDCAEEGARASMSGRNVGDLLNQRNVTWGWFEGGFRASSRTSNGQAVCATSHIGANGKPTPDYVPHHQPFQYYQSTANPHHLAPANVEEIGHGGRANHQYDLVDFWAAVEHRRLPAVSFLKARAFEDGHAGYSSPIGEQNFLVETLNRLQQTREWEETAVIIAYDDSDGWYDHVLGPIVSTSATARDALTGPGACGVAVAGAFPGRCGYGPRLPLVAVSPFAKVNFVDHSTSDQSSILRFIEDNWRLGRVGNQSFDAIAGSLENLFDFHGARARRVLLDPASGQVTQVR